MRVELERRRDGAVVLRCVRDDGSIAWQRQDAHRAAFFPAHDLTHLAVETVLDARDAFFGLVAAGWAIDETEGTGARGPLPAQAVLVEHLVGFLDAERASGDAWPASAFAAQVAAAGLPADAAVALGVTDEALARIRTLRGDLLARWAAVPPGESLVLRYAPASDASSSGASSSVARAPSSSRSSTSST